jgi:hypothetical protein
VSTEREMLVTEPCGSIVSISRDESDGGCCRTGFEDNGPGEAAPRWSTIAAVLALLLPDDGCAVNCSKMGAVPVTALAFAVTLAFALGPALAVVDRGLGCAGEEEET